MRRWLSGAESREATLEAVSHYLRVLGVELPVELTGGGPKEKPLRFITRLRDEEGLFIWVNTYAADVWLDAWCRSNPLASEAQKRGAGLAAHLLNTVDVDAQPPEVRVELFKLGDRGELLKRSPTPARMNVALAQAPDSPPSTPLIPSSVRPRTAIALTVFAAVFAATAAGLLAAVLLGPSEDNPTLDPERVARDAPGSSRSQVVTADPEIETKTGSDSSSFGKPTARSPGAPGARAAIERHWLKREREQLSSAYADLSPRFRADPTVGSESAWVARQKANPLQDIMVRVRPKNVRERTAQVDVVRLRTQTQSSGCSDWSGLYTLVRSGGRWLIDSASLSPRSC